MYYGFAGLFVLGHSITRRKSVGLSLLTAVNPLYMHLVLLR